MPRARGADALLALSAISFGTLPIFGKVAYAAGMNVQSVLGLRFLLAGAVLVGIALARRAAWPPLPTVLALVALGAVGYVGQSAAYFNSLRYVPAAVTSILLYTYPAIVVLLSRPLYGAPLGRGRLAAVGLALAGCVLVASPAGGGLRWEGVVLGLASAAVYSGYILTGKRVLPGVDPWLATAVVATSSGATYLAVALGTHLTMPSTALAWGAIAGLALIATVVAAGAFLAGLQRTDPGRASLVSTLEPVSTAGLAALLLGERLGAGQLAGGALVLIAVVIVARSPGALETEPPGV
jgi:drug/metabolite transporter (DMT)-like permease